MRRGENRRREDNWRDFVRYVECLRRNSAYREDFKSGKSHLVLAWEWSIFHENLLPDPEEFPPLERMLARPIPPKFRAPSPYEIHVRAGEEDNLNLMRPLAPWLAELKKSFPTGLDAVFLMYFGASADKKPVGGFGQMFRADAPPTEFDDRMRHFTDTVRRFRARNGLRHRKPDRVRWPRDFSRVLSVWDARFREKKKLREIGETMLEHTQAGFEKSADRYLVIAKEFVDRLPVRLRRIGSRPGAIELSSVLPSPSKAE